MYPNINMENTSQKNMVDSCLYHMKWHRISRSFPALFGFERTDPGGRRPMWPKPNRPVWTKPLGPLTERLCNAESSGKGIGPFFRPDDGGRYGLVWLGWLMFMEADDDDDDDYYYYYSREKTIIDCSSDGLNFVDFMKMMVMVMATTTITMI
jgi:hypothetical protein